LGICLDLHAVWWLCVTAVCLDRLTIKNTPPMGPCKDAPVQKQDKKETGGRKKEVSKPDEMPGFIELVFSVQSCKVVCDALRCRELMSKVMVSKAAGFESCFAAALYSIMIVQVSQGIQSQLQQCKLLYTAS